VSHRHSWGIICLTQPPEKAYRAPETARWSGSWADLQQGDILSLADLVGKLALDAGRVIEELMFVETAIGDVQRNRLLVLNTPPDLLIKLDRPLRVAEELCQTFALTNALAAVRRMIDNVKHAYEKPLRIAHVIEDLYQIRLRILDELQGRRFFYLDPPHANYYREAHEILSPDVLKAFPTISRDIEEASKCYALGRYTGCVFHLMRVMEHGMNALATELGVSQPYRTWDKKIEKLSEALAEELRKSYSQTSPLAGRLDFFKQATERLTAVQHALRNETMHARSHYGQDDAEDIYRSTVRFIEKLSEKLAEAP
jgi:hypothetical protein